MKRKLHFVVVALDESIASAVYGPLEVVQACALIQLGLPELEPCEISTEILSPGGAPFLSSSGYRMPVDGALKDVPAHSAIYVSGFGLPQADRVPKLLEQHAATGAWLKRQQEAGSTIVGSCAGNFFLAEYDLLSHRRATTYWIYADLFRERYPHMELDLDAHLIEDRRALSVGGGVCGLDAVLAVVERFAGRQFARMCTKILMLENLKPSELRYEKRQPTLHNDPLVDKAVHWIRGNLGSRLTVEDLLRQVPASRRNLSRRFKQETGEGIQAFIQRLRIDRAKLLLETSSLPIEQILDQVGYQDPSAFARQFKRHTQLTPNNYRQRYGLARDV